MEFQRDGDTLSCQENLDIAQRVFLTHQLAAFAKGEHGGAWLILGQRAEVFFHHGHGVGRVGVGDQALGVVSFGLHPAFIGARAGRRVEPSSGFSLLIPGNPEKHNLANQVQRERTVKRELNGALAPFVAGHLGCKDGHGFGSRIKSEALLESGKVDQVAA